MELASGCKIKCFRSDGGGEYANDAFKAHFHTTGIKWEPTVPYAPEQNGLSERINCSISEHIQCILKDSNTPKSLWTEAANTIAYFLNCNSATFIGKTSYEV